MSDEECVHGMPPSWCATCSKTDSVVNSSRSSGLHPGESKQELLDALCLRLGLPTHPIGVGSSLPSEVFEVLAETAGVPKGSMPEIGEAVATKAGLPWTADCDSRGTLSGGGSTVTREGLVVINRALDKLKGTAS